jgi:hypothetical protein
MKLPSGRWYIALQTGQRCCAPSTCRIARSIRFIARHLLSPAFWLPGDAQAKRAKGYRAREPIGSQAGSMIGSASRARRSSSGIASRRAAISKTYSSNHESFMV